MLDDDGVPRAAKRADAIRQQGDPALAVLYLAGNAYAHQGILARPLALVCWHP
jgi:hypothetical protein